MVAQFCGVFCQPITTFVTLFYLLQEMAWWPETPGAPGTTSSNHGRADSAFPPSEVDTIWILCTLLCGSHWDQTLKNEILFVPHRHELSWGKLCKCWGPLQCVGQNIIFSTNGALHTSYLPTCSWPPPSTSEWWCLCMASILWLHLHRQTPASMESSAEVSGSPCSRDSPTWDCRIRDWIMKFFGILPEEWSCTDNNYCYYCLFYVNVSLATHLYFQTDQDYKAIMRKQQKKAKKAELSIQKGGKCAYLDKYWANVVIW